MTQKNRERFSQELARVAERFSPEEASLSRADVKQLLESAGCDVTSLKKGLYESSKKLQIEQRKKLRKPPQYLNDVVDFLSPSDKTIDNPAIQVKRAESWLEGFVSCNLPVQPSVSVLRAYRRNKSYRKRFHNS